LLCKLSAQIFPIFTPSPPIPVSSLCDSCISLIPQ
jgi:hypothetical protein